MNKENLIDLDKKQLALLYKIIKQHIPSKTVWAYGSRVTWKAHETSDLDLAVFDCTSTEIFNLIEEFVESHLLVSIDVMDWDSIPENFKKNIKEKYVVLQKSPKLEGRQEVKLGKVVNIISGGTPKTHIPEYWDGNIPWLSPPDFTGSNRWVDLSSKSITELGLKNSATKLLEKGDVIISARGTVGALAQIRTPMAFSQTSYGLRAKPKLINTSFLFYVLKDKIKHFKQFSYGTVFETITIETFDQIDIFLPFLSEQKCIAEVLSSLDDKIDLLHRQNKTLEDMAQTLFRQWFVEEADERWEGKPLGETVDVFIGRTPPRKEFQWFEEEQGDWKWISIKDMAENGIYLFNTSEYLTQKAVSNFRIPIIPANTVILSFKMTVGRVKITAENMLSNEAIAQFKVNSNTPYSKEYLYFYLKTFKFDSLGSTSSIVTSINTAMIKSIMIPIPDRRLTKQFGSVSASLFGEIHCNQHQICTLKKLRDILLPKLMKRIVKINK